MMVLTALVATTLVLTTQWGGNVIAGGAPQPVGVGVWNPVTGAATGIGGDTELRVTVVATGGLIRFTETNNTGITTVQGYNPNSDNGAVELAFRATGTRAAARLGTLVFLPNGTSPVNVEVSATPPAVAANPDNGHFYEYVVPGGNITWLAARCLAKYTNGTYDGTADLSGPGADDCVAPGGQTLQRRTFNGRQGYLASLTTATENAFVVTRAGSAAAWVGGTDMTRPNSDGQWRWVDGPEAAVNNGLFWVPACGTGLQGFCNQGGAANTYNNWNAGEPNNDSKSDNRGDALQLLSGGTGLWNDLTIDNTLTGFIVEYGGLEGDSPTTTSTTVHLTAVPAPTSPTATPDYSSVQVSWTTPVSDGRTVTGYTVTANPGGATCSPNPATSTSCTVTGLSHATSYTFSVVATWDDGVSSAATTASVTPLAAPAAPTVLTASLPNPTVGVAYSMPISVVGGTAPYAFSLTAGVLPDGFTLSAGGVVSGTGRVTTTSAFTVTVTDSSTTVQTVTQAYSLVVESGASSIVAATFAGPGLPTGWTVGGNSNSSNEPPGIVDNALRLTTNTGARSGFAIYDVAQPTAAGLDITFNIAQHGGTGADGISFFLIDGAQTTVTIGQSGGGLGYQGLTGALLGVGFDAFGNFAGDGCGNATNGLKNALTIRGPAPGYCRLQPALHTAGVTDWWVTGRNKTNSTKTIRVVVEPASFPSPTVKVYVGAITDADTPVTVLNQPAELTQASTFKFGFSAATGGSNNNHDVWNVSVKSLTPLPPVQWQTPAGALSTVVMNQVQSVALAAELGVAPYTYSVVGGAVPAGMALAANGVISGTPTTVGTSTFTVRVTDSQGTPTTADREFSLTVALGVRTVALQASQTGRVTLGDKAIHTQRRSLTRSGAARPYTMTHTAGAEGGSSYSYLTDVAYGGTGQTREGDERGVTRFDSAVSTVSFDGIAQARRLYSNTACTAGNTFTSTNTYGVSINTTTYCSVFGPEVWSESFYAEQGESLSFRWAAQGGDDDYEAYAFLVNTADQQHTVVAYGRGKDQLTWLRAAGEIPATGTWQFRFVNGSFDRTGGYWLGATMYVDPVITVGQSQTITFTTPEPAEIARGATINFAGLVSASSGLTVTLTSETPAVCTVAAGTFLVSAVANAATGAQCRLRASQAGSALVGPAADVVRGLTVTGIGTQAITFTNPGTRTYGSSVELTASSSSDLSVTFASNSPGVCTVSGSEVTVLNVGTCSITATQPGDATFLAADPVTQSFTVSPKALTITGATTVARVYDGTTNVTIGGATLVGALDGDIVQVQAATSGAAVSKNAGTRGVTTAMTLAGSDADNYTLTQPSLTVVIEPRAVSLRGTRVYDGSTTVSAAHLTTITNRVGDETLTVSGIGEVALATVAAGEQAVAIGTVTLGDGTNGGLASNYTLIGGTHLLTITPRQLTVSGAMALDKVYDGSDAIVLEGATLVNTVAGDEVQLTNATSGVAVSKNAGTRGVTTAMTLAGSDADNYTLTQPSLTVVIEPRAVSLRGTRVYDGSTTVSAAHLTTITNRVGDETLTVSGIGEVALATVAAGEQAVAIDTLTLGDGTNGGLASNYTLTGGTHLLTITRRQLSVSGAMAFDKVYDGSDAISVGGGSLVNTVAGDDVRLINTNGGVADSKNVGMRSVATTMTLAGSAADNYTLTQPGLQARIGPRALSVAVRPGLTRVYDRTTTMPLVPSDLTVTGTAAGELIRMATVSAGTLTSRLVGVNALSVNDFGVTALGGAELSNYVLPTVAIGQVTLTPRSVTVQDAAVQSRPFNGLLSASLTGAQLLGVLEGDRVTLVNGDRANFVSPDANSRVAVVTSMSLGGPDAANYRLAGQPSLVGTITKAPATLTVTLPSSLVADNTPKFVVAATSPVGLTGVEITYNGSPLAPTDAGSYLVVARLVNQNYEAPTVTTLMVVEAAPAANLATRNGDTDAAITPATQSPTEVGGNGGTNGGTNGLGSALGTPAVIADVAYVRAPTALGTPSLQPVITLADGSPVAMAPMEFLALVDGVPVPATLTVIAERTVNVSGDGFSVDLEASGSDAVPLAVDESGNLRLSQGGVVAAAGSGFQPGSRTEVWMFSTPVFLGTAAVDAGGGFANSFVVPAAMLVGPHTIQLNGIGTSGQVRSLSLGVVIEAPTAQGDAMAVAAAAGGGEGAGSSVDSAAAVRPEGATTATGDGGAATRLLTGLALLLLLIVVLGAVGMMSRSNGSRRRAASALPRS